MSKASLSYLDVLKDVRLIISEVSGVEPADLFEDISLLELGLDSLMFVRMGRILEKRYQVHIAMKSFYEELHVIGQLGHYLSAHGSLPDAPEPSPPISTTKDVAVLVPKEADPVGAMRESVCFVADGGMSAVMEAHMQLMERYLGSNATPQTSRMSHQISKSSESGTVSTTAREADEVGARSRFAGLELDAHPLTEAQDAFVTALIERICRMAEKSKEHTGAHRSVLSDWKHSLQFRRTLKEAKFSLVTNRASGAYIYDLDGNRYIDFTMGMGVSLFGHSPKFVQDALHAQLDRSIALGPQTPLAGEVALKIKEITGHDRVSLSITGSSAVMLAVRIARAYRQRNGLVKFGGAYHGISSDVLTIAGENGPVSGSLGVPDAFVKDFAILDYGSDDALDYIRTHANELAAVLVEPVQSRRPGYQPHRFLRRLRQVTKETGVLLISDEMINGFRIGPAGAQGWFGFQADLATYGKIVGGGLPMSAIAGRKELLDLIDGGDWNYGDESVPAAQTIFTGGTHNRHPLALAGALAVLDHIQADAGALYHALNQRAGYMVQRLNALLERLEAPIRCTSFGSQFRFECQQYPFEMEVFFLLLQERGIYTWEQHICCLSTAHSDADIDCLVEAVESAVLAMREGGFPFRASTMPRRIHPMSSVQQRLYALHQRKGAEFPYHLSGVWEIRGDLDRGKLELCLHDVICRHESLRTAFLVLENRPVQYIVDEPRFFLESVPANGKTSAELLEAFIRPFDLANPPLFRAGLVELDTGHYFLLVDVHHLAADGLSMNIVLTETFALYNGQSLRSVTRQCRHAQSSLQSMLDNGDLAAERDYWLRQLADISTDAELPLDYTRPNQFDFKGQRICVQLAAEHTKQLRLLARENKISLFMLLLAAFGLLLRQLTGRDEQLIGLPVAGRPGDENDDVVGMFVNTLVLRLHTDPQATFEDYLLGVREVCLESYSHQDYPFGRLLKDLQVQTRPDRNPLFDVMFSYERADERRISADGLEITSLAQYEGAGMFDFNIDVIEEQDVMHINGAFATSLFKPATVQRWMDAYKRLLENIHLHTDSSLREICILSASEREQITHDFNRPVWDVGAPTHDTIVAAWKDQVSSTPDGIAIFGQGNENYSYAEADERAKRVAAFLQAQGAVTKGTRVGVCVETEAELIFCLLGILACGAVYVPFSLDTPVGRLKRMVRECDCKVVISSRVDLSLDIPVVHPADTHAKAQRAVEAETVCATDVAYVIFTSGSTGTPKGVAVEHGAIMRTLHWRIKAYAISSDDVTLQIPACSFDASILDIFSTLLSGAALIMLPAESRKNLVTLSRVIEQRHATNALFTPSLYRLCLEQIPHALRGLRFVTLAGEALPVSLAQHHYRQLPEVVLWNEYGPTENSVISTAGIVPRDADRITLGRPVDHVDVYILDDTGSFCPIGVWGEIWVAGPGLARGYEGQPELTDQVFRALPCNRERRAYRTGDVGRWLEDGQIAFRGRRDGQVKLHGYRIERDEIEHVLRGLPQVQDAVVDVVRSDDEKPFLAAWVVLTDGDMPSGDAWRRMLSSDLPVWMTPSVFVHLDAIPLSPNGKVDRMQLPPVAREQGDTAGPTSEQIALLQSNPAAHALLQVCQDVLGNSALSLQDHYFSAGGDSISGILLVSRLQEKGWHLEMDALFHTPVLADLVGLLTPLDQNVLPDVAVDDIIPTPMQARFLSVPNATRYMLPFSFWLQVSEDISFALLQRVVLSWGSAHPGLLQGVSSRATEKPTLIQLPVAQALRCTETIIAAADPDTFVQVAQRVQETLSLQEGPLLHVVRCKKGDETRILVAAHHFVFDGVSIRILVREWQELLTAGLAGQELPALQEPVSVAQWTAALVGTSSRPMLMKETPYWHGTVDSMPNDFLPAGSKHVTRSEKSLHLSSDLADALLRTAHQAMQTRGAELLLAAFVRALGKTFDATSVCIEMESHGRSWAPVPVDVSATPGWFTSAYPVILSCDAAEAMLDHVIRVKDVLRRVPNQGVGYGVLKYLLDDPVLQNVPSPRIAFNHLGQLSSSQNESMIQLLGEHVNTAVGDLHPDFTADLECYSFETSEGVALTLAYCPNVVPDATVDLILKHLHEEITTIIGVCQDVAFPIVSAGDLLYRNLETDNYQQLLERLHISTDSVEDIYPLTPMQEGLLLESQRDPDSEAYFEQMAFRLSGSILVEALADGLQALIARHPGLRAAFYAGAGVPDPVQIIYREASVPVRQISLIGQTEEEQQLAIRAYMQDDRTHAFSVLTPPLMRVCLFDLGAGDCHVVWSHHHLLMDGWCIGLLVKDWMQAYGAGLGKVVAQPPAAPLRPYFEWLDLQDKQQSANFWTEKLLGYEGPARLPVLQPMHSGEFRTELLEFNIPADLVGNVQSWVASRKATMSTFLRLVWGALLSRYSYRTDVVFGSIASGRPPDVPRIEEMVGLFINAIPVRFQLDEHTTASHALDALQQQANEARKHEHMPLGAIQEACRQPELFDHLVVLENYPMDDQLRTGNVQREDWRPALSDVTGYERTHYPFTLVAVPTDGLQVSITYDARRYTSTQMSALAGHFQTLFASILREPDMPLHSLGMMLPEERNWLFEDWNARATTYPVSATIDRLFDEAVARFPERLAVSCGETLLSYTQLAKRVDALAHSLTQQNGYAPTRFVALWLPRDESMIIAMLAVLKVGMAYVPLDPVYPADRVRAIIEDCDPVVVVSCDNMPRLDADVPIMRWDSSLTVEEVTFESVSDPDQCAYVIYTSGSTGKPKGCMVSHRNVVRLMVNDAHDFDFSESDVWACAHSFCFDFSVWEMYGALLYGGKLVIAPTETVRDTRQFLALLRAEQVTVLNQTPAAFYQLSAEVLRSNTMELRQHLRMVVFGGDRLDMAALQPWVSLFPLDQIALINMYGITETTVHVTYCPVTAEDIDRGDAASSIGRPLPETEVWVKGALGEWLPPGVPGELCVGGSGVSMGYLYRDDLTHEKFQPHPFKDQGTIYCSGDMGVIHPNGFLLYLGRNDHQVQVRGFRVETGEIVHQLLQLESVSQAVVLPFVDDGTMSLVAYVVAEPDTTHDMLRNALRICLPEYMVPSIFVHVESIPLTSNGKVDRGALPPPRAERVSKGFVDDPPCTDAEKTLARVWGEVLDVSDVARSDHFFEMGGQSLKAVKMVSLLEENTGFALALKDVFSHPVLKDMAGLLLIEASEEMDPELDDLLQDISEEDLSAALDALQETGLDA